MRAMNSQTRPALLRSLIVRALLVATFALPVAAVAGNGNGNNGNGKGNGGPRHSVPEFDPAAAGAIAAIVAGGGLLLARRRRS